MEPRVLADGSKAFHLRFQLNRRRDSVVLHERPNCWCGCGGGWNEITARTELGNILARVRVGVWERPKPPLPIAAFGKRENGIPTYANYSEWWLEAKKAGVIGDRPAKPNTVAAYKACLRHLNAYFGRYRLDEIDADLNLSFKAHLTISAQKQREALAAGADLRDHRGRRLKPLGPATIAKILGTHRAILEEAVEDRHIGHNTACGRRMKVRVPKPKVTFLEADELAYLVDAAVDQDAAMSPSAAPNGAGSTARAVTSLAMKGLSARRIASELGLAKNTITDHLRRLGAGGCRDYVGRRAVCEILGRAGPRVEELTAMRIGDVRLHDPEGARFRIHDSKSEAGVREVEMSPVLVEVLLEHIDRLRRFGLPSDPDAYLVPNLRGGRMSRRRVAQIVREAAELASERLAEKGLPPLPHTTPHTLRRTYISIALVANECDVKFVMGQVGHANSKMTMDVYAQLEKRLKRSHGKSFDRLLTEARERVEALPVCRGAHERYDVVI